jgi:hypothetical protein
MPTFIPSIAHRLVTTLHPEVTAQLEPKPALAVTYRARVLGHVARIVLYRRSDSGARARENHGLSTRMEALVPVYGTQTWYIIQLPIAHATQHQSRIRTRQRPIAARPGGDLFVATPRPAYILLSRPPPRVQSLQSTLVKKCGWTEQWSSRGSALPFGRGS